MNRHLKRAKSSKQIQPKCKKRINTKDSPMVNMDTVSNPNSEEEDRGGSLFEKSRCTTCGKQH